MMPMGKSWHKCIYFLIAAVVFMIWNIWKTKGDIEMVDMYTALVIAGKRTCNTENTKITLVPTRYRAVVLENLDALGLDADGSPKQ